MTAFVEQPGQQKDTLLSFVLGAAISAFVILVAHIFHDETRNVTRNLVHLGAYGGP